MKMFVEYRRSATTILVFLPHSLILSISTTPKNVPSKEEPEFGSAGQRKGQGRNTNNDKY